MSSDWHPAVSFLIAASIGFLAAYFAPGDAWLGVLGMILGLALTWVVLICYFAPTRIAMARHHDASTGIFFLNASLGWTGLFWIVCFIWAYSGGASPASES